MRCADFTPTPGKRRSDSINASRMGSAIQRKAARRRAAPRRASPLGGWRSGEAASLGAVISPPGRPKADEPPRGVEKRRSRKPGGCHFLERELHSRRQRHAGGELGHFFLRDLFG